MKAFKKRILAVPVMSLVIIFSLMLTAKTSIIEAVIILLILLALFAAIDFITTSKLFSSKQARVVSVVVGVAAITGIGLWGAFAGTGTSIEGRENHELDNTPSATVTDEAYDLGLFYFERGDYEEAIQALKGITNSSASYVEAQKLLAEGVDCYRNGLMNMASAYVEKDDYKLAIEILNAGLDVIPDDAVLLRVIDDYSQKYTNTVRIAAIADAETYAADQDYEKAIKTIGDARDEVGTDAELDALRQKYLGEYKDFALIEADRIFNAEGYEAAIQFLQEVQKFIISDTELSNAIDEYESYKPVSLDTLGIWQYGDYTCGPYTHETVTDNYGNVYNSFYSGCDEWASWTLKWEKAYNVYKIDGAYSTLSGVFCIKKEYNSDDRQNYLYIYGDNVLLETYTVKGGDAPVKFSTDISGVTLLKIQPDSERGYGGVEISFASNLFLTK